MDAFRFSRHELVRIGMTAVIELIILASIQGLAAVLLLEPWRSIAIIVLSALVILGGFAVLLKWLGRPVALVAGPTGPKPNLPPVLEHLVAATTPPAQPPRDPKWEQGDQLMFEGLALLDEIRKGGNRTEQASAWLEDVREFLRVHNPTAWTMFDAPVGLLPFKSTGYTRATVELATAVDRALFLIRVTNPRRYARAGVAIGGASQ
jgi:hypothetical protein